MAFKHFYSQGKRVALGACSVTTALLGALALPAQSQEMRAETKPPLDPPLKYGPFDILYGIRGSMVYDDNIYISPTNKQSDVLWTIAPSVTLGAGDYHEQQASLLSISYTPSFIFFTDQSRNNAIDHDAQFSGQWRPGPWKLGFQQVYQNYSGGVVDVGNRVNRQIYNTALEGVYVQRMHKDGMPRRDACVKGAGEIALAITMATLTTIVVFVPVSLVEGEGQFFLMRLALPLSVSLLASLLVALVFVPLSVYLTLPANDSKKRHAVLRWSHARINVVMQRFYDFTIERLNRLYCHWLEFFLKRRLDLVLALMAMFAATYFIPFKKVEIVEQQEEDQTGFEIGVEIANEYSFADVGEYFREAEKVLVKRKDEYGLKGYFVFYRQQFGSLEGWFDKDKPRKFSAKQVGEKFVKEMPKKPGIKLHFGRENEAEREKSREVFVFHLEGDDAHILDEVAARLEPMIQRVEGVLGIRSGENPSPSEMALVVDRDRANASSVNPEVIAGLVGYALRGSSLPKYNHDGREIPVRIRFQESDRESLTDLSGFQIPVEGGGSVPLSALISPKVLNTAKNIFRSNKRISRTLTVELKKAGAKEARDRLLALQRQFILPEGVSFSATRIKTQAEEMGSILFAAELSVMFIYLLMGFLFESFILPLSIICTIPLGAIGVSWIHYVTGKDMDFLGLVGAILLIGVVVNNGIVLIDYVIRLRAEGMERAQALVTASARRFRPIAMTALTTIIGMIPLTFAPPSRLGISYKSFGFTLIGGMTTATIFTLLVVPIFYTFFDDARLAFLRLLRRAVGGKPANRAAGVAATDTLRAG